MSDNEKFRLFKMGLKPKILMEMEYREINRGLREIQEAAQKYDDLLFQQQSQYGSKEEHRPATTSRQTERPGYQSKQGQKREDPRPKQEERQVNKDITCFNCGKMG